MKFDLRQNLGNIFVVLVIFVTVGVGVALILEDYGVIEPTDVQLFTSGLLVLLTTLYVFFTAMIMLENVRHREQDIQPGFAIQMMPSGVEISNVGNGPAINAEITLALLDSDKEEEESTTIKNQDIPSGDSVYFTMGKFESLGSRLFEGEYFGDKIRLKGEYTDLHNDSREITSRTYDLKEYQKKSFQGVFKEPSGSLRDIQQELSAIKESIRNMSRFSSRDIEPREEEDGGDV